jgi:hypothetical protein
MYGDIVSQIVQELLRTAGKLWAWRNYPVSQRREIARTILAN